MSEFPNLDLFYARMAEVPEWARHLIGDMMLKLDQNRQENADLNAKNEAAEKFIAELVGAMEPVIVISDRQHEAWYRVKEVIYNVRANIRAELKAKDHTIELANGALERELEKELEQIKYAELGRLVEKGIEDVSPIKVCDVIYDSDCCKAIKDICVLKYYCPKRAELLTKGCE